MEKTLRKDERTQFVDFEESVGYIFIFQINFFCDNRHFCVNIHVFSTATFVVYTFMYHMTF